MQIDKDTQILIDERLKNNAPALESFTPQELRALRAKMAETPLELRAVSYTHLTLPTTPYV